MKSHFAVACFLVFQAWAQIQSSTEPAAIQPVADPVFAPSKSFGRENLRLQLDNIEKNRALTIAFTNAKFDRYIKHQQELTNLYDLPESNSRAAKIKKTTEKFYKLEDQFQREFEMKLRSQNEKFQKIMDSRNRGHF